MHIVGDSEADLAVQGLDHAARLDQPADPYEPTDGHMFSLSLARSIEENHCIAHGEERVRPTASARIGAATATTSRRRRAFLDFGKKGM